MVELQQRVESLIDRYITVASECIENLLDIIEGTHPLHAWKLGELPQAGVLPNGTRYRLHGIGCRFETNTLEFDVDFCTETQQIGFDAWRLYFLQKQDIGALTFEEIRDHVNCLYASRKLIRADDAIPHLLKRRQ